MLRPAGRSASQVSLQGEFQRRLYKELVKNYNPLERPVANDSQPLTVYFSLSLLQIMDVVSLARRSGPHTLLSRTRLRFGQDPQPPVHGYMGRIFLLDVTPGQSVRNRLPWLLSDSLREKTSAVCARNSLGTYKLFSLFSDCVVPWWGPGFFRCQSVWVEGQL